MKRPKAGNKVLVVVTALIFLGVGICAGWIVADKHDYAHDHKYQLLDPSVSSSYVVHQEIINFDPLRQQLKNYFAELNLDHSLYFEYLPNGINVRDGADDTTIAASLMKTPVVMDLYKLAEVGKLNLDDTVVIKQSDISTDQDFGNPNNLQAGETISLRNAAQMALHDSDNTAIAIVKDAVTPLVTNDTDSIQSLDVSYTVSGQGSANEQVEINARSYSSLLKCLYYSCFNTPKDSQEMLSYLIGSAGHNELMAGVPSNIKVAHKIGSANDTQSDCGIIYQPDKPYLVCLMFFNYPASSGNKVNDYFKTASKMIHDYIVKSGNN